MKASAILAGLFLAVSAVAQGPRLPAEVVDAFHAALHTKDTAAALSLLDRGLVVYEFGLVDPTVEAYAFRHLPFDMDVAMATQWKLEARHLGGTGDERWVLSTYHVTGKQTDGTPIDQTTLETAIPLVGSSSLSLAATADLTTDITFVTSAVLLQLTATAAFPAEGTAAPIIATYPARPRYATFPGRSRVAVYPGRTRTTARTP